MIDGISADDSIPCTNIGRAPKMLGGFVISPGQTVIVPSTFVQQFGWDAALRFDFSKYNNYMASRTEDGRFTFDWWCPLSMVDGYGRHALAIFKGFKTLGCEPILRDVGWIDKMFLDAGIEQERYKGMYRVPSKIGAVMSLPYDTHIYDHQSIHKIVITQFETNHIPERHVERVNLCEQLIVTSKYQPKIWRNSGCEIPISVMTPGIDTDSFAYKERVPDGNFKILLLGAITERKNPLGAIRIFRTASGGNPNWRLTIKTRKTDAVRNIFQAASGDPRIKVEIGDAHPDFIKNYYYTHDVLLWPSKGEGVGLPPLEMMATGGELVCSQSSGMLDYVYDSHCYPIKISHMEAADGPGGFSHTVFDPRTGKPAIDPKTGREAIGYVEQFGSVGEWWVPDENHAISQLQKCFDNWMKGNGKGKKAAEYVRKNHTLAQQSESILKVLRQFE